MIFTGNLFLPYPGFIVANITATDNEGDKLTVSLDGIGADILNIVDEHGVENATGPSPLKRKLSLKKKLDREVGIKKS
jgi:hypothetical protein